MHIQAPLFSGGWRHHACRGLREGKQDMAERVGTEELKTGLRARGGAMLLRATLAQNVETGCAFGGIGVSILAFQDRFHASMGLATMGLSLTILTMTALGPLIATLLDRWGLRRVMSTGVLVSLIGYVVLAYAPSIAVALIACAGLIGPGAALFAALPPAVLAGGWFPHARGRATGIAYLPPSSTITPVIGVSIMQRCGLTSLYLHLLLLPLTLGAVLLASSGVASIVGSLQSRSLSGCPRCRVFFTMSPAIMDPFSQKSSRRASSQRLSFLRSAATSGESRGTPRAACSRFESTQPSMICRAFESDQV